MKLKFSLFALAMVANQSHASDLDKAIALYEQREDSAAMALFKTIDSAESLGYQANLLMSEDLDDAEELIEDATERFPDNARLHFIKGRIMGQQASEAFLSALSYAEKSLESFQKAAQLEPNNPQYLEGLMMFYLQAPGIAGGDEEKAKQAMDAIVKLDREKGAIAKVRYLQLSQEDISQQQLTELTNEYADLASMQYQLAMYQQYKEDYEAAFSTFELASNRLGKNQKQLKCDISYQIGRTAVMAESHIKLGLDQLQHYLSSCEIKRDMPGKDWANFRLANLLALADKQEQAQNLYKQIKDSTDDSNLLKQLKKVM